MVRYLAVMLLFIALGLTAGEKPSWSDDLEAFAESQLAKWKVPGAAVAVVKDGEIIYASGFGYRDLENKLPVDADTLFAIGSCSKAFTATSVGLLVEQGKLDWQEPVVNRIPDFKLKDDFATLRMTPEDLLCHRSGLPRHDVLWYLSDISREEMIRRFRHLEPSADFRTRFQYNNLMFMTAGYLVGQVAGTTWEAFVGEHIFMPLGMKRSNFSVTEMQKDANHSMAYDLDEDKNIDLIPHKNIDNIGPAGSINSSVNEMARWMIMNLAEGKYGEKQVVKAETLSHIHRPHIWANPPGAEEFQHGTYGLGWGINAYHGSPMIAHSGGIDGFISRVLLFPDKEAGIVVLTNQGNGGYQVTTTMGFFIADRILEKEPIDWVGRLVKQQEEAEKAEEEEEKPVPDTKPSHALVDYTGTFHEPGYGEVTISMVDDSLRLTYYQTTAKLEHWHFDTFDMADSIMKGTKVEFMGNGKGEIGKLAISMEDRVDDIVFTRQVKPEEAE